MLLLLQALPTALAVSFPSWSAAAPALNPPAAIAFDKNFGSSMVLQMAPAKACVTGALGIGGTGATLTVHDTTTGASYDVAATAKPSSPSSSWKACLKPTPSGGDFTLTVRCAGCADATPANISAVTFGDVWYCGGQSNMALPLMHTFARNASRDAARGGAYGNLRLHGMAGNMNPFLPWSTIEAALATNNDSDKSAFGSFSSTCFYFGQALSDRLGADAPPIGLVHTAFGGSTIEQWLTNASIAKCARASIGASNQEWHDQRVLPYADMTLKGWVWYQGENDMHNFFGNSALDSGYSCLMAKLVAEWRAIWTVEPGTTAANAPFGLVTLAPSGTEGGKSIGTMRWAQTAGYGATPNAALPNVFTAQAYDLNDPNSNITCYGKTKCHDNSPVPPGGWPVPGCDEYCASVKTTNFYMGPIHPRDKKPVGERLAQAASVMAYGHSGHMSGPTLTGCRSAALGGGEGKSLTLTFSGGAAGAPKDAIKLQPYYDGKTVVAGKAYTALGSKMEVLLNASLFCMQLGGGGCLDDGTGRAFNVSSADELSKAWVTVDISPGSAPNEVHVDLSRANGTAFAIRYADIGGGACCSEDPPTAEPCAPASCPLMGASSGLPANPFVARVVGGKCKCVAPQTCDA